MTTRCTSTRGAATASLPAPPIALGHYPPGSTGSARQQGRRHQRAAQRQRPGHLRRRPHARRRQQLQRFDQRHRHRDAHGPVRARPAAVLREQRRPAAAALGGTFPFGVVDEGQRRRPTCRRTAIARSWSSTCRRRRQGRLIKRIQARRQRARDDARRVAVQALRGAGQRRPGRGHRHATNQRDGEDRRARAGRHAAARPEATRARRRRR